MTPGQMARELGLSTVRTNGLLHELPRPESERYGRWDLTPEQAEAVRNRVRRGRTGSQRAEADPAVRATGAWFWEGNVQVSIATHLASSGWRVFRVADTLRREQGDDIRAVREGRELVVEVKGYPSVGYADPARARKTKPTTPSLQAEHWLAGAMLKALRLRGTRPGVEVAIGLPRMPRYEHLLAEMSSSLRRLEIRVLLVSEDGSVADISADIARTP